MWPIHLNLWYPKMIVKIHHRCGVLTTIKWEVERHQWAVRSKPNDNVQCSLCWWMQRHANPLKEQSSSTSLCILGCSAANHPLKLQENTNLCLRIQRKQLSFSPYSSVKSSWVLQDIQDIVNWGLLFRWYVKEFCSQREVKITALVGKSVMELKTKIKKELII